jgi:pyruvate-formate lyase-activating enzyme
MTPVEVWEKIDEIKFFISGISVSGGEPSLQIPFLVELFKIVKERSSLTTLIETNGFVKSSTYDPLFPYLDMASVDLKAVDPEKHLSLTYKPLKPVLETIKYLHKKNKLYSIQQVIVDEYTANDENIIRTAKFIDKIDPNIPLKLLRFRPHGTKGESLNWPSPSDEMMNHYVKLAKEHGLKNVTRSL